MQCKGKLRVVAKVDNPDAVAAMLRHLGLDQDPNPDPKTVANEFWLAPHSYATALSFRK